MEVVFLFVIGASILLFFLALGELFAPRKPKEDEDEDDEK